MGTYDTKAADRPAGQIPWEAGPSTDEGAPESRLYRAAAALEQYRRLDCPAERLERLAGSVLKNESLRAAIGGRWLGHALHPLLTDWPLGLWMSASLLDVLGGPSARTPARRLIAFGLAAALPTSLAGLSDWLSASQAQRRVGTVHAATNASAVALYSFSLAARYRGRYARGVALALAGGLATSIGGYLGGHLSCARDTALRATYSSRWADPRVQRSSRPIDPPDPFAEAP